MFAIKILYKQKKGGIGNAFVGDDRVGVGVGGDDGGVCVDVFLLDQVRAF